MPHFWEKEWSSEGKALSVSVLYITMLVLINLLSIHYPPANQMAAENNLIWLQNHLKD